MTSEFTCDIVVTALRQIGFELIESRIEIIKNQKLHTINSFRITKYPNESDCLARVEIYDRTQYATDKPFVGMFFESGGLCYGDHCSTNSRVSCLNDIFRQIGYCDESDYVKITRIRI